MSNDLASDKSLRHRLLVQALSAADVAPAAEIQPEPRVSFLLDPDSLRREEASGEAPGGDPEECIECDIIEQRLGRRSQACMPLESDGDGEVFTLSRSARLGHDCDDAGPSEAGAQLAAGVWQDHRRGDLLEETRFSRIDHVEPDHAIAQGLLGLRHQPPADDDVSQEGVALASHTEMAAAWPMDQGEPADSWQSTFHELNAALAFAKTRLRTDASVRAMWDGHQAWPGVTDPHAYGDVPFVQEPIDDVSYELPLAPIPPAPRPGRQATRLRFGGVARHLAARVTASGSPLLACLALLIVSMGMLPFAPALLGGLIFELADGTVPAVRWDLLSPEVRSVAAKAIPKSDASTSVRPPAARGLLTVTKINRTQPGGVVTIAVKAALTDGDVAGAFAVLRDYPAGATFSQGQALGPNLWTLPADQLGELRMNVPQDAFDITLMTIEALSADSILLAQASTVIVVERPVNVAVNAAGADRSIRHRRLKSVRTSRLRRSLRTMARWRPCLTPTSR
jgi:hypothetical protein